MPYVDARRMKPQLTFHTEGFVPDGGLATLASRRADSLLLQVPGIRTICLTVIFETLPNGQGVYAARGRVTGQGGEIVVTELARDPDAAILRIYARLSRSLPP